jgi:hypothetical protein
MMSKRYLGTIAAAMVLAWPTVAQTAKETPPAEEAEATSTAWSFSILVDGFVVPDSEFFVSPIFSADHHWLHLEARYNYEDQRTGSLWAGYNFTAGHRVAIEVTPMLGGVFGNSNGIAPGYHISLAYWKVELSSSGEYVFNTDDHHASFFYSWPQVTFTPVDWLHAGFAAQRTKTYHTKLDVQRGPFLGFSHKSMSFTTYVFNPGLDQPTVVFEAGFEF